MTLVHAVFIALVLPLSLFAKSPFSKDLPQGLASFEKPVEVSAFSLPSVAPIGPVISLGEWEEADSVMTLWPNSSYVKALTENGNVTLLADDTSSQREWSDWLQNNNISAQKISYLIAPTDSIWIRDYGPLWILDGQNQFGIVDTTYNRPRPNDDKVPSIVARALNVPIFTPQLVHTGGNYYNDGYSSAFSSTLVFRENRSLSMQQIMNRVLEFLGIERYTTSPLGEKITIEHIDTFGKLVSPDTWVFSDFPQGSQFKADSDRMVDTLSKMTSAYGTPYKIFRMPMVKRSSSREDYRAYINSFISNGVLYFPTYGNDAADKNAAEIYQRALPGYKIVGVNNGNTEWGDSVHCRSRNLIKKDTIFLFPKIISGSNGYQIQAKIIPSPGATLSELPVLQIEINGKSYSHHMASIEKNIYAQDINIKSGDQVSFYIKATDSTGKTKAAPSMAPAHTIDWIVP